MLTELDFSDKLINFPKEGKEKSLNICKVYLQVKNKKDTKGAGVQINFILK